MSKNNNKAQLYFGIGLAVFLVIVVIIIGLLSSLVVSQDFFIPKSEISGVELTIVSGSENASLQPLIEKFNQDTGAKIKIEFLGSIDILLQLNRDQVESVDAVWPASSLVLNLTDNDKLKHQESMFRSPVILGLKQDIAQRLNWTDSSITVNELLTALSNREFKMAMTNATQSNSGLSGYLGFLQAFAKTDDVLTKQNINQSGTQENTRALLNLVNKSSGSSGWLKDSFLSQYNSLDAMINYESLIIETNQELVKQNRTPLQAIYLEDGTVVSDSPLAYLDKGDSKKEEAFLKLQEYLLSQEVQDNLLQQGRRTSTGLAVDTTENNLSAVFDPNWGLKSDPPFVTLRYPQKEVIEEILNLYQISLRKPSLTYYVIDVSGSMEGKGLSSLKEAMQTIINQQSAKEYFLQASPKDISVVIPFNDKVQEASIFEGNSSQVIKDFSLKIEGLAAGGGTDIYSPTIEALKLIEQTQNLSDYFPAVILMTDGRSENEYLLNSFSSSQDIPVFAIMFGDAKEAQLDKIVEKTSGKVFDGRQNLVEAFRNAKGYN
jgi:Ca-activated chloride channel homolog